MAPADLLLEGGIVIPMDGRPPMPGSVAVTGDRIVHVGASGVPARRAIDCEGRIVLPGLVNAHTHVALVSCRGISHRARSALYDVMWPVERHLTPEDVHDMALMGLAECLKSGTTCVADHYFFVEEIARAAVAVGIRAVLGHTVMAQDGPWVGERELEEGIAFVERWRGRHPRIRPVLAPHAPDTMTTDWLREMQAAAERLDTLLHMHVAQSDREVEVIQGRAGLSPVAYLHRLGLLGPRLLAVHCTRVDDADLDLLARSGAAAVYCPTVHSLRGRPQRASELVERGVRVALGTDCAAGNDDYDMWEEMRQAIAGQRVLRRRPDVFPPEQVLTMATRGNAAILGLPEAGVLLPGHLADIVVLRADVPRMQPLLDPVANVVFCASQAEVEMVIVGGQVVVEGGRLATLDEAEVVRRGAAAARRVLQRAGIA